MKLLMIIDSMELNGGSVMFLEMAGGIRKYYPEIDLSLLVVSKTGEYGRKKLINPELTSTYGFSVPSINYAAFKNNQSLYCGRDTIVVHHRLGCTKPLNVSGLYVVVNHTVEYPRRMKKFEHASIIISVCGYIADITKEFVKTTIILNGVENDYISKITPASLAGKFKTGRCTRLSPSKFNKKSLQLLERLPIQGHIHHLVGPSSDNGRSFKRFTNTNYMGPIFNRHKKMSVVKALDVYFYDASIKEGASIAILESLASGVPVICRPKGGNIELVTHGLNGFHMRNDSDARKFLMSLSDRSKLSRMKESTMKDFDERLHIRYMLSKYMKVFNKLK